MLQRELVHDTLQSIAHLMAITPSSTSSLKGPYPDCKMNLLARRYVVGCIIFWGTALGLAQPGDVSKSTTRGAPSMSAKS